MVAMRDSKDIFCDPISNGIPFYRLHLSCLEATFRPHVISGRGVWTEGMLPATFT